MFSLEVWRWVVGWGVLLKGAFWAWRLGLEVRFRVRCLHAECEMGGCLKKCVWAVTLRRAESGFGPKRRSLPPKQHPRHFDSDLRPQMAVFRI